MWLGRHQHPSGPPHARRKLVKKSIRLEREQLERQQAERGAVPPPDRMDVDEDNEDVQSPPLQTARVVRISRNLDAVRTVHFGPTDSSGQEKMPDNDGLEEPLNSNTSPFHRIPRRPVGAGNSKAISRPPSPYPFAQPPFTRREYRHGLPPLGDFYHFDESRVVPPPHAFRASEDRTQLSNALGRKALGQPEPKDNMAASDSLYGKRTLVRVSSTLFQDSGFAPTPRLDHWLEDVEDHTNRRRAQLAADSAAVEEFRKRQAEFISDQAKARVQALEAAEKRGNEIRGVKHERDENDPESLLPEAKRARPSSFFGTIKRQISTKKKQMSGSVAGRRLSGLRQSAMGALSRASAHTPLLDVQAVANMRPLPTESFRFALVRDSNAGKSSLIHCFIKGEFSKEMYHVSAFNTRGTKLELDGYQADLELWDISTSAQNEQANPLVMTYFHAVLICYSVENEHNIASVTRKWQHIVHQFCERVPVFVVGLKKDLRPTAPTLKLRFLNEQSPATRAQNRLHKQGESVSRQIGAVGFAEISAKTGEGVNELFEHAVRHAMNLRSAQNQERTDRLRREKVKNAMSDAAKTATQLFCFQDPI